ncbi:hypothetical protein F4781DRAFT_434923 [Annulohypoxylon bovei var. microspora]|nr:hypothetical protein F4781DRAFT_434923 [Annulohypoxylon bovei var. microspora]
MDEPETAVAQLEENVNGFLAFTGVKTRSPNDRFILVLGMTGSGKSTFVARCTGKQVHTGHDIFSCTDSISIFDYIDDEGRRVYLIDTPGFDDTSRSDADTLQVLGTYLSASYTAGIRIDGVVFLQRITDVRMGGSSVRNLSMVKAMCDLESYARFAVRLDLAGWMMKRGLHDVHIISRLLARAKAQDPIVLRIQRELADNNKTLDETLAGQVLHHDIIKARKEHPQQIQELQSQIATEEQARGKHHALVKELRQEQKDLVW